MREALLRKAEEAASTLRTFFEAEVDAVAACARAMAERLADGGTLYTLGNGGSACDAQHAAVEFLHPVVTKRRAFPARALAGDLATVTAIANDTDFAKVFADQVRLLAGPGDVLLGLSTSGRSPNVRRAFKVAAERGLLSVALTGKDGGDLPELATHCFVVPSYSIHRIQEVHVALLHTLWDAVHLHLGEDDVL